MIRSLRQAVTLRCVTSRGRTGFLLRGCTKRLKKKELDLNYELSSRMCADIYTKAFTDAILWVQ
eukprot:4176365-Heterocapsa_arctica.AAC.1